MASAISGIILIENQIAILEMMKERQSINQITPPYLNLLPGNPEALFIFLAEEKFQQRFNNVFFKKIGDLRTSLIKAAADKNKAYSARDRKWFQNRIAKVDEDLQRLELTKRESLLR
ncbi:MAG: hypothetical protein KC493_16955 [Bacteriovoracaceae bacterium]|nr:hypothetical protein [Bacteriovoracaceae bacterium]